MKRILFILSIVGLAGTLAPGSASGGGDEVVVVYNSRLPESKALAEYYAAKRQVPKNQVFGFALPAGEEISRKEYNNDLQTPLAKKLEAAKLWRHGPIEVPATNGKPARVESRVIESKIRYVALCYGVPLRIAHDKDLFEAVENSTRPE
ncbi:MAG: TIGR03790 family protein, partial [Verrucomicrobiota bacterium]